MNDNGPVVEGGAVCLERLCGWKGPFSAPVRAAFVTCPECGTAAMFLYRGGEKVTL